MKLALVALLAAVVAAPAVYVPTPADAQVRVGSGARRDPPRRVRPPAPALTEAEEDRLWDAQAEIEAIDTEVAGLQALVETQGALTPEQQARINTQLARRTTLQADVTRLEAKRDRR